MYFSQMPLTENTAAHSQSWLFTNNCFKIPNSKCNFKPANCNNLLVLSIRRHVVMTYYLIRVIRVLKFVR